MQRLLAILLALATFPVAAAITYPVDVTNTQWAILDLNTGDLISRNQTWPRSDGGPIQGLATNLVYLLERGDAIPQYDVRLFTLQSTERVDVPNNEIHTTWQTPQRPKAEQIIAAKNEELIQAEIQLDEIHRELVQTRLMVQILIQATLDSLLLPPKMTQFKNQYSAQSQKLWRNRDRLNEIINAINTNGQYNIDQGWEPAP